MIPLLIIGICIIFIGIKCHQAQEKVNHAEDSDGPIEGSD